MSNVQQCLKQCYGKCEMQVAGGSTQVNPGCMSQCSASCHNQKPKKPTHPAATPSYGPFQCAAACQKDCTNLTGGLGGVSANLDKPCTVSCLDKHCQVGHLGQ